MNDEQLSTDKNEYYLLTNEIHITEIGNGSNVSTLMNQDS